MFPVESTKTERQFGAAALAICISWFNLIWFLRRVPDIGTYILTLQKVFKTLVKVNEAFNNHLTEVFSYHCQVVAVFVQWCGHHKHASVLKSV